MSKIAALFSGQGAQYPGMGRELFALSARAREVYEAAGDILGFDVAKISFEGDEAALSRTAYSQPAIFALSVAAYAASSDFLPLEHIACVAGHSLGEYAALCCAGAYSVVDGFRIIKARAAAMDEDGGKGGAMYAIMGCGEEIVRAVCAQVEGFVEPVNFNQPTQTVISGEEAACAAAAERLTAQGAKAVRLPVSGAFHTKMMQLAAERFQREIAGIAFWPLKISFYSNLTGGALVIDDYPDYFARHMVSPVRFVEQMNAIAAAGVDTCVEFGPKRTVATLAKKNCRSMQAFNVEDAASLEKLREAL